MAQFKRFPGLKLTSTYSDLPAGVTTLTTATAATTYYSSAVPCKGASAVVFTLKSTDANALASTTSSQAIIGQDPTGAGQLNASAFLTVSGGGASAMNTAGGLKVVYRSSNGTVPLRFFHDYISLGFLTNAVAAHTVVTCAAEVWFDNDASAALIENGFGNITVPL